MAVIQFPLSLIGSDSDVFLNFETRHVLPAIGVGTAGLTSHYCLSNAFRSGDATLVVPLDFMRIPIIAVVGWAFYGERLDIFVLLGALIIVSGVLWNLRSEVAKSHREQKLAQQVFPTKIPANEAIANFHFSRPGACGPCRA